MAKRLNKAEKAVIMNGIAPLMLGVAAMAAMGTLVKEIKATDKLRRIREILDEKDDEPVVI